MADATDTTTQPQPDDTMAQVMRLAAQLAPQQSYAPAAPVDRSVVSLLGEALGGGTMAGMSPADREAAGTRALLNFGTNMLAASGPSVMPRSFGQIFAQGVGGAEQSLGGSEEVAAARLGAQQAYQEKQQELRMEAIKQAIPLLKMQMGAAIPNTLLGGAGAPGSIGAPVLARDTSMTAGQQGNNPGNVSVTPGSPLPAGASAAIPVAGGKYVAAFPDVPTGVAAHSDTLNSYAASGTNTIRAAVTKWVGDPNVPKATMDSYVADVAKAAGVDPDATIDLTDPAVQRAFILAQQPHESGKTWLSPGDVDKGLALATARRQGRPGAPATAAAPQGAPAPAPTATAPAAKPGTPALPVPPAPPVITDQPAGGAQVAGPGAPTAARVGAVSPAVPGDVNTIIRGMTGAGADATTLAPPEGVPAPAVVAGPGVPAPPSAAEVLPLPDAMAKAKATGQPVLFQGGNGAAIKPDGTINMPSATAPPLPPPSPAGGKLTFEQFQALHPIIPTDEDRASWTVTPPDLTQARAAQVEAARQLSLARAGISGDPNKSLSDYNTATQNVAKLQADADAKSKELQAAWLTHRVDTQRQLYNDEMTRQAAPELEAQKGQQAIDLANVNAKNKAQENEQTSRLASRGKVLDKLDTDAEAAHENLTQLQMVKELSDAAGPPGVLANYPELRSWLVKTGIAGADDTQKWSAQQALDSAANRLTLALRSGSGFSRMTNMDLQFLQHTSPQSFNPQEWRDAQIAYLMTAYERQQKFTGLVHRGVADGMSLSDAQNAADTELGPTIKQLPTKFGDGSAMTPVDQARWNWDNLLPGSFYKDAAGNLRIFKPGKNTVRP